MLEVQNIAIDPFGFFCNERYEINGFDEVCLNYFLEVPLSLNIKGIWAIELLPFR